MHRILIIDDDFAIRDLLEIFFKEKGFDVVTAPNGHTGLNLLKSENFDIFLVDLVMQGMGGLDVLKETSAISINIPAVVITAYSDVSTAVEAMKLGASDYITKPFILDELVITVNKAIEVARIRKENFFLKRQLKQEYNFQELIGTSPQMQKVYSLIRKVADTDSTVLIYGESGTGKEVVAKTLHYNSSRSNKPFVPLNCAAIPNELIASELFGHEKGAFTGAISARPGRFELACGGTIFLDEIGELHPSVQVKLLRVLQEREFERVGGTKTLKTDVRVLAATNKNLERAVEEGAFREDLFYRLNVIPFHIPPLRNRKEDIPLLINHFMKVFCSRKKRETLKIPEITMKRLMHYKWHGNVRELRNLIERLVILNETGTVTVEELPERFNMPLDGDGYDFESGAKKENNISFNSLTMDITDQGIDLNAALDDIEQRLILQALERAGGIKKKAAELLSLNRTTLIEKMKKKGISL